METLKNEIKRLVEYQKQLKNQRRTERLIGDRTMEPWEASYRHLNNRQQLRLLYATYGLLRGKKFSVTENTHSEENHPLNQFITIIDKLVIQYGPEVIHSNQ